MHLHIIDHYHKLKSPIHRLDGRIKLVFILAVILTCSLLPNGTWPAYIVLFSILISLVLLSDLQIPYVLKRSMMVLPFLLTAVPLLFRTSGPEISSFTIGNFTLTISMSGLIHFLSLAIKSWLSVIAAILLASTTSFTELLEAMSYLKAPTMLVAVFGLMWRYLFLLVDEVERLIRARLARSGHNITLPNRSGGSLLWRSKVTGGMAGSLFVRSIEKSERVYNAMLARGYDGKIRALEQPPVNMVALFWLIIAIALLFLIVISTNWLMSVP